jgi:integrase
MQALAVSLEVIDRRQNHVLPGSKVRRHHLHHDDADEKREAWRVLGERLLATLVLSGGARGAWTPHDLRRTGATIMQSLGIPLDTIDRCQNHVLEGSKVRRHYFHHDYAKEKRDAWRQLGERISMILEEGNAE